MRVLFFLSLAILVIAARADVLTIQGQGQPLLPMTEAQGQLVPVEEPLIAMAAEKVTITEGDDYMAQVTCVFRMHSLADEPVARTMAFPVVRPDYAGYMGKRFTVSVNGQPVKTMYQDNLKSLSAMDQLYWKPDYSALKYAGFLYWPVTWKPGETLTIECRYPMDTRERVSGLASGWQLRYIVLTGGLWHGPIGQADIIVQFARDPRPTPEQINDAPNAPRTFHTSYPEQARWVNPKRVEWHFTDWTPTDDMVIQSLTWVGAKSLHWFRLPYPYTGDKERYTEAMLDTQVERALTACSSAFPAEVKACNRTALRSSVADYLSHEILARHGDPFVTGKTSDPQPSNADIKSADGYYYSRWRSYFISYMYHGGWYQPDVKKKITVSPDELNEIERANREFLQGYLPKQ